MGARFFTPAAYSFSIVKGCKWNGNSLLDGFVNIRDFLIIAAYSFYEAVVVGLQAAAYR